MEKNLKNRFVLIGNFIDSKNIISYIFVYMVTSKSIQVKNISKHHRINCTTEII